MALTAGLGLALLWVGAAPAVGAVGQQVAVDPDGDALVVWERFDSGAGADVVEARGLSGAGVLGPTQSIGTGGSPRVAVDDSGAAAIVWLRDDGVVQLRRVSAAGVLGPVVDLSASGATDPRVAVDADGDAVVVWELLGSIQLTTQSAAGVLGGTTNLNSESGTQPRVAVDASGAALAVWRRGSDASMIGRARTAGGLLGPQVKFSGTGADNADLAMNAGGDAVVVSDRFDPVRGFRVVQARARSAGGVLSPVQRLNGSDGSGPRVAIDLAGDALIAWRSHDGGVIRAVERSAGGALVAKLKLSGRPSFDPQVAMSPAGQGEFAWDRLDTVGLFDGIYTRRYSAGGSLGEVSPRLSSEEGNKVQLGVDDAGAALLVWGDQDGAVLARTRDSDGTFGATLLIAGADGNNAPVAADDPGLSTNENAALTDVDVLGNDSDPDAATTLVVTRVDDVGTVGLVTLNGDGTIDYDAEAGFESLGAGDTATDAFRYMVSDGRGGFDWAAVTVTVTGVNDAPVAVDDPGQSTDEDTPVTIDVLANDTDPDGDPLSVGSVDTTGSAGNVTVNPDDTLEYDPAGAFDALPDGGSDTDTFTYTANDGTVDSNSATVTVQIDGLNDAPTAVDDAGTTNEDTQLNVSAPGVLANDTDPDTGDTKTVTELNGSTTLSGSSVDGAAVTINADGSFSYNPGALYQGLSTGQQESDSFTYTMEDGPGAESTATVNITIDGVSDAPVAGDDSFDTPGNTAFYLDTTKPANQAGKQATGSVLANDSDPDTPAAGLSVVPVTNGPTLLGGSVTIESDGDFTYVPPAGGNTNDTFSYTVTDGVASDSGTVTMTRTGEVWYVRNNQAAGGTGRSTDPFDTIVEAETASGAGDTVYVFDGNNTTTGLDTGFVLESNQRLLGEAVNLVMGSDTLFVGSSGNRPTLAATNEDVAVLASGGTVSGLALDPAATGGGIFGGAGVSGSTLADLIVSDGGTTGSQPGIELDGTSGTFNISDASVTTSGATGMRFNNNSGTVNLVPGSTISISTANAKGLEAIGTNMGTGSVIDVITVTGSGSGGVSMTNTSGTTTLGDGAGTDLDLTTTSGATPALSLSNAGTVSVPAGGTAIINAIGGPAVDASSMSAVSLPLDTVSSTNSAGDGIRLDNLAGSFSASGGSIQNATGQDIDISGNNSADTIDVTYNGSIIDDLGTLVNVSGQSGGTKDFNGAITDGDDADGSGITLTNNTGATNRFDGGLTLATGGNPAFAATGGGTVNVTDPNGVGTAPDNTIATTTGTALNVANTTIGASGLSFRSISSNGAANGIVLNNTGATGGFTVTGNGGSCTSAVTCTGGAIQNATGTGISLTSVLGGVSLTRVFVNDSADDGIGGSSVNGLTLDNATVTSNGNANGDNGIDFTQLTGTSPLTSSNVSSNFDSNVFVSNASGVLNLNVTGGTYSGATGGQGDAIFVEGTGTGSQNLNVQGPITFANNVGDHVQHSADADNTTDSDVTINNATMTSPAAAGGGPFCANNILGGGIVLSHGGNVVGGSNLDATVTNNNIQNSCIGAIAVGTTGSVGNQQIAQVDATIQNNTIGTTGVAGSGSVQGNGIFVDSNGNGLVRTLITGNTIRQWTNRNGIALDILDGDAEMSATVRGNLVTEPNSAFAGTTTRGMTIQLGSAQSGDSIDACLDIGHASDNSLKNTLTDTGESPQPDVRYLHEGPGSVVQLAGFAGSANQTDITAWFTSRNIFGPTPVISGLFTPPAGATTSSVASCPQPAP